MKILKFYSPTCGPCKVLEKHMRALKMEYTDVDATLDENQELVDKYEIYSMPTLVLLNDSGEFIHKVAGLLGKSDLETLIRKYV